MIKSVTWARAQAFARHQISGTTRPRSTWAPHYFVDNGQEFLALPEEVAWEALDGRITFAEWARLRGPLVASHPEDIMGEYRQGYLLEWEEGLPWWKPDGDDVGEPFSFFLSDVAISVGLTWKEAFEAYAQIAPLFMAGASVRAAVSVLREVLHV